MQAHKEHMQQMRDSFLRRRTGGNPDAPTPDVNGSKTWDW